MLKLCSWAFSRFVCDQTLWLKIITRHDSATELWGISITITHQNSLLSFTAGIMVLSPKPSSAVKALEVRLGAAVTLQCDLSYHYEINWLRMSTDMTPELLIALGLKNNGELSVNWNSNSSRFQGFIKNRLFHLRILCVSGADLLTYFCAAMNEKQLEFNEGKRLYGKELDAWWNITSSVGSRSSVVCLFVCFFQSPRMHNSLRIQIRIWHDAKVSKVCLMFMVFFHVGVFFIFITAFA